MAKFNTGVVTVADRRRRASVPTGTKSGVVAHTHEGGSAFAFDEQSELFMTLSGSFITEKSFYEGGDERVQRVRDLIEKIVLADPSGGRTRAGAWFAGFTKWLRTEAFIRTGAVVLAAEAVHALREHGGDGTSFPRQIIDAACGRGDEPGELLGYWLQRFGKPIPSAVKRGLADAVVRLYSEYSTLRYDTASHPIRFGDVVELVQPRTNARAAAGLQNHTLYRHLIDRRHDYNTSGIPEGLATLRARAELEALPVSQRREVVLTDPARLKAAAMSWEALAGWLQGPMDAAAWEAIIPTMGYMAQLRNLRNFDEAGISKRTAAAVATRLALPSEVLKSRQLPFRFWTAYREVANDRWKVALGDALELATQNIPGNLGGRTLALVDTSASMGATVSDKSSVRMVEVGAMFGVAMAYRFGSPNVDVCGFANHGYAFSLRRGASVLDQVSAFTKTIGQAGHGTDIPGSLRQMYKGHDRVVIFSDMQSVGGYYGRGVSDLVPANVPVYGFNLAGYSTTVVPSGSNRHNLGGFSDKSFSWMALAEQGLSSGWPWETSAS